MKWTPETARDLPVVEVEEVERRFGAKRALGPVSFSIARKGIVGILGLNGAGKTTLLRIMAGDLRPTSGVARIDGLDLARDAFTPKRRIGYLPESPPLYRDMGVRSFLRFVATIKGVAKENMSAAVETAVERAGIGEVAERPIGQLSHGYRQRVGLAQAIVHSPSLTILDEPTNGLDPVQIVAMRELIRELGRESAIIVSSHVLGEVSKTCDRVIVIHRGRLVADRSADDFGVAGGELERLLVELVE